MFFFKKKDELMGGFDDINEDDDFTEPDGVVSRSEFFGDDDVFDVAEREEPADVENIDDLQRIRASRSSFHRHVPVSGGIDKSRKPFCRSVGRPQTAGGTMRSYGVKNSRGSGSDGNNRMPASSSSRGSVSLSGRRPGQGHRSQDASRRPPDGRRPRSTMSDQRRHVSGNVSRPPGRRRSEFPNKHRNDVDGDV